MNLDNVYESSKLYSDELLKNVSSSINKQIANCKNEEELNVILSSYLNFSLALLLSILNHRTLSKYSTHRIILEIIESLTAFGKEKLEENDD